MARPALVTCGHSAPGEMTILPRHHSLVTFSMAERGCVTVCCTACYRRYAAVRHMVNAIGHQWMHPNLN